VKILDFGLSRFLDPAPDDQLTQSGVIMGTPSYMAPEQARASPVDHRADVYGVGAILYTVLTGRPPFMEDTPHATILAVLQGAPPPPSSLERAIPPGLEAIVLRALARNPEERYADASALERDLDAFESQSIQESLPPRLLLPPEPAQRASRESKSGAEGENTRLALLSYLIAAMSLFVGAAAASVPGVELATRYTFNRVEMGLFLLAVAGTALTPALLWLTRRRTLIVRNRPEVGRILARLRTSVLTFIITYGLGKFVLELVDGFLVRLFAPEVAPLGASFPGWSLLLPLLALVAALGRLWLQDLATSVRPGWRRLLATWSAAGLLLLCLGALVASGLRWRERSEARAERANDVSQARSAGGAQRVNSTR
jgi:serine/threonine-protein kinase